MPMPSIETILGVRFFNGTVDEAVETMSIKGGLLVVPAAPTLVKICYDEGYRGAVTSADMVIADSGAMVLLWKIFTGRRVERISGLKFLKRLVARLESQPNERVLWIVPTAVAYEKTITWLRSVNLTATADFYIAPRYAVEVRDDALLAKIGNPCPTHVVVGIGGGVQEKLGLFLKENLHARPAIHCIGAALAFLTGDQPDSDVGRSFLSRMAAAAASSTARLWSALFERAETAVAHFSLSRKFTAVARKMSNAKGGMRKANFRIEN